jgi:hypothetical protein
LPQYTCLSEAVEIGSVFTGNMNCKPCAHLVELGLLRDTGARSAEPTHAGQQYVREQEAAFRALSSEEKLYLCWAASAPDFPSEGAERQAWLSLQSRGFVYISHGDKVKLTGFGTQALSRIPMP